MKTLSTGGSKSDSQRLPDPPVETSHTIDDIGYPTREGSESTSSPTRDGENQSPNAELIDTSEAESESESAHEPPPKAPPRHNIRTKGGKYYYT
ncbi:hypothetical protein FRC01_000103, partial [Tulasnella sp. 417]